MATAIKGISNEAQKKELAELKRIKLNKDLLINFTHSLNH